MRCACSDRKPDRFSPEVRVRDLSLEPEAITELDSFDTVFYNLGNDAAQHAWILDIAGRHPGVAILHNVTLHSLFLGYYLRHLRQPDLYIARMAECYGIEGLRSAHRILGPGLDGVALRVEDDDLFRYTFTEEALHSATGAVVHSHWHAEIVRRLWAGPVCEAWLRRNRRVAQRRAPAHGMARLETGATDASRY